MAKSTRPEPKEIARRITKKQLEGGELTTQDKINYYSARRNYYLSIARDDTVWVFGWGYSRREMTPDFLDYTDAGIFAYRHDEKVKRARRKARRCLENIRELKSELTYEI